MYRLATLNDMISLVAWKQQAGYEVPAPWGLKRYGTLLCERHIRDCSPLAVLEAGVGFNSHFHDFVGESIEYWTIDKEGFYNPDLFRQGLERRHRAKHVDGLVGDFHPALPEEHFDLTFSISALEHSDASDAPAISADLFRITKPGGFTVHTIDTPAHQPQLRLEPWHDALLNAGFEFIEAPDLASGSRGIDGLAVLFEPLDIHVSYYKNRPDFWENPHLLRDHQTTIVVVARRPDVG